MCTRHNIDLLTLECSAEKLDTCVHQGYGRSFTEIQQVQDTVFRLIFGSYNSVVLF
ncbi:hypothetical protein QTP88_017276 [Uroleucon formosanum]